MIKKFICWFWGHDFLRKAYTGKTYETTCPITYNPRVGHYHRWQKQEFCLRCGKKIEEQINLAQNKLNEI